MLCVGNVGKIQSPVNMGLCLLGGSDVTPSFTVLGGTVDLATWRASGTCCSFVVTRGAVSKLIGREIKGVFSRRLALSLLPGLTREGWLQLRASTAPHFAVSVIY